MFPDGKITTGRNLNSTPIGIKGWNTNAICIEIYGDFDKGKDIMTNAQKKAVIALYGELCKRFDIEPSTNTIRPHCWFTAGGAYLGKYDSSRSAKTCPGTNFMGFGCSPAGFAKFINLVKDYVNGDTATKEQTAFKQYIVRCTVESLNGRKGPSTNYDIETKLTKGTAVTIVDQSGKWLKPKSGYWIHSAYVEFVRYV